jgi:predicted methyltransferase
LGTALGLAMQTVVLSHYQARMILEARAAGQPRVSASPDLGLSVVDVCIDRAGASFPSSVTVSWEALEEISEHPNSCYAIEHDKVRKIACFSESSQRAYSLMPTTGAPTLLVSGVPMHRIKGTDPHRDTLEKVRTMKPLVGQVLDTCTGLGYTAIQTARTAERVTTVELDPAVLEIARQNPWSRALFDNPVIAQRVGDAFDVVAEFADAAFARIIHDPPAFSLAGELYSTEFYVQLHRVLGRGGRLFHYVGSPESRSGRNISRGVSERLRAAGFTRVQAAPQAFGLVAYK